MGVCSWVGLIHLVCNVKDLSLRRSDEGDDRFANTFTVWQAAVHPLALTARVAAAFCEGGRWQRLANLQPAFR